MTADVKPRITHHALWTETCRGLVSCVNHCEDMQEDAMRASASEAAGAERSSNVTR